MTLVELKDLKINETYIINDYLNDFHGECKITFICFIENIILFIYNGEELCFSGNGVFYTK